MITNTLRADVHNTETPKTQANISIPSKVRQFFKRNAYNLHRWISIVALVPALLWSLSGTSHPFMAHWFKPPIAKEFLPPQPIDQSQVIMPLAEALKQNNIREIKQFRLVNFKGAVFYQIQQASSPEHLYLETRTGTRLQDGDALYAEFLAKQYFGNPNAVVLEKRVITGFDDDYRYINRLLPVWKVSFQEGGYDVYVETSSGRMATYNTPLRRAFLLVFQYLHNWGWLNGAEILRLSVITTFLAVIILTALSGIVLYIFTWKKRKQQSASGLRKYHRSIGIAVSFSTLMFASSGLYHALHKERLRDEAGQPALQHTFRAEELNFGAKEAAFVAPPLFDISAVKMPMNGVPTVFYRFSHNVKLEAADECCAPMQSTSADKSGKKPESIKAATYFNAETGKALPQGDIRYARHVAMRLAGISSTQIVRESLVTEFKGEYGFINKRLPVQRIDIASEGKPAVYIETQSGTLAARVQESDRAEGFVFAYIHKLEFLKPLGKDVRDGVAVALGLVNSVVAVLGLMLFVGLPRKR
ncbi:MAG: PepSY domain-containing protein [Candidatus Kapaibacterium sp.]|nr:MAG: PepSY domain-containing protein [Candidatus Kapabacteria bacterium]